MDGEKGREPGRPLSLADKNQRIVCNTLLSSHPSSHMRCLPPTGGPGDPGLGPLQAETGRGNAPAARGGGCGSGFHVSGGMSGMGEIDPMGG